MALLPALTSDLPLTDRDGAVRMPVRVRPRASTSRIEGVREGALTVRLAAPPVNGAANDELVRLLAQVLGLRRAAIALVVGDTSRTKVVEVRGVSIEQVRARLEGAS
jgi:hypothetical protein